MSHSHAFTSIKCQNAFTTVWCIWDMNFTFTWHDHIGVGLTQTQQYTAKFTAEKNISTLAYVYTQYHIILMQILHDHAYKMPHLHNLQFIGKCLHRYVFTVMCDKAIWQTSYFSDDELGKMFSFYIQTNRVYYTHATPIQNHL
jgi:hypothetical protein